MQLYTPVMLNRYGGNLYDSDPRYNYTDCCGDDFQRRLRFMTRPCLSITDHLDWGTLSIHYDGLFYNSTTPKIYATMAPTTAVEIGEGFVLGLERAITKVSGAYEAPAGRGFTRSLTYTYNDCELAHPPASGGTDVTLALQPRQIAVIVWA